MVDQLGTAAADCATIASECAAECAAGPVWSLSDADLLACLDTLHQAETRLATAMAHLVAEITRRDLPATLGASSMIALLHQRLRISPHAAKRQVELGAALRRWPVVEQAMTAGTVNAEQVRVIDECLTDLSGRIPPDVLETAETDLVTHAEQLPPRELRHVGERILTHVAPELAEESEAQALARAEARAAAGRRLALTPTGTGQVRLTGWLTAEGAAVVNAALDPLCRPVSSDDRSPGQRRVDALVEICGLALRTGELPEHGGDRPHITITLPYQQLRTQAGAGVLDTGELISAAQARRVCCDANLLPAVLGGASEVLDLGRTRRPITGALRRALIIRDRGCAFPGCARPARWCDGHHIRHWADGGETSLDNAVLICKFHHSLIHHGGWETRLGGDGHPEFIPPAYVDPQRRPRRNQYHRRN
jgi:hypothetical protein